MKPDRAWVRLSSGRRLNLIAPESTDWTDLDLAVGLSRTYRWGGHSIWDLPLPVAQHSLLVLVLRQQMQPHQPLREHAILWGSLRRQCDCFIAVRGAEAGIAMTEGVLERIVQHRCPHVEEGLHSRPIPTHLLLLVHAFGNDLVDRTLHERGRDRFAIPAPGGVMDQRPLVSLEVGQQLADVVSQAPDACHAEYRCTPRPAA